MREAPPQTFPDIAADFNATAKRFLEDLSTSDLLLTKYSALLTFRLKDRSDKEELAAALFDCCEKFLEIHAEPGKYSRLYETYVKAAEQLLSVLAEPETALLLPKRVPARLGEFALVFVKKAEELTYDTFPDWSDHRDYRANMHTLAPATLKYAKKIKALADRQTEDVFTSKKMTVPRPLVLKKDVKNRAP